MTGPEEIELGSVLAVFGVKGELRVHLHHPESALWKAPCPLVLVGGDGTRRRAELSVRRGAGKRWLGRIAGVDDRDAAARFVGARLLFPKAGLPAPASDEFYWWQIEGAPVELGGVRVGRVVQIHHTGGNDVLEVRTEDGRTEFVPCVRASVERIDATVPLVVLAPGASLDHSEE